MFRGRIKNIHFVGIGGSGMSGIAEVLVNMGFAVSGSDMKDSAVVKRLKGLGSSIVIGHHPSNVANADVVVKSTAIPDSNVEIMFAREQQIPVIPRAEMLSELMRMKYGVAVAGSHGKTTTTSMLAVCMHAAGLDPTVVIGGRLNSIGTSARLGEGEFMLAEADESDGSFMLLSPTVAVITNIDPEHMDHWKSEEALIQAFIDFASKTPFFGFAALCMDHPTVQALLPKIRRRTITYGLNSQAEFRATNIIQNGIRSTFSVLRHGKNLGAVTLNMPGNHNISNALATIAVSLELGAEFNVIAKALANFTGVERRFTIRVDKAEETGSSITVIDDYAHHPVEIEATLQAAKKAWPNRRIIAVFQPHRYSRVQDLYDDFCRCFNSADKVVVCPIYAAGEKPIESMTGESISRDIKQMGHRDVISTNSLNEAEQIIWDGMKEGDVVITLGAGTVNEICFGLKRRIDA